MNRKKAKIIIGISLGIAVIALIALIVTVIKNNSDRSKEKSDPAGQQETPEPSGEPDPNKKYPGSYVRDTYDVEDGKRTKIASEEFDLDAEGREIRSYQWMAKNWGYTGVSRESLTSYDSLGRKVSETWTGLFESDPSRNYVTEVKYEYDGETDRVRFKRQYDEKGNLEQTEELQYNGRGDAILEQTTLADGTLVSSYEREYDEFGNLLYEKQENHGDLGQENTYPPVVSAEYDASQRKVTVYGIGEEDDEEGSYQTRNKLCELYYDASGRLIREKGFSVNDNVETEEYAVEYLYGSGRTCEKSIMRSSDGWVAEKEFDASGRVVLQLRYNAEYPEDCDKYVYDWEAEDSALPGQKILRVSEYNSYNEELKLKNETCYLLNDQKVVSYVRSGSVYKSTLTCFSTTFFESPYRTPEIFYDLEEYSQTKYQGEETIRYLETEFDSNGRKLRRTQRNSLGKVRLTEYDDHGNIVKDTVDYGDDDRFKSSQTEYEYTYY
ncbi:MAG: hypothetical protein J6Y20_12380 [Lachnospiraceae bacterium]|nr:hypothetical protein [Lachnospiraceae bacterium]